MSVLVRWRKLLVRGWSAAVGRTAALVTRDAVWDALKLLRQNREQVEEALRRLDALERIEEATTRAAERQDWLTRAHREPATPLYDTILATRTRAGLAICIDGRDGGEGAAILAHGAIEPGLDRLMGKLMRPGGVAVDVGAHFGYYTLLAALYGGPGARVYAIEPNPHLAPLISRSARVNGFADTVRVLASAVSDAGGRAPFGFDPHASGAGRLAGEGVEVEVARLDDLIEAGLPVDLVKLDVAGHEGAALRGMSGLLHRSPDIKLVLNYAPALHATPGAALDLIDDLAALGFAVWKVDADGFLAEVAREELTSGRTLRLVAARRRPDDRDIRWEGDALARDRGGWLALGPEWPLPRGRYEASVGGEIDGEWEIAALCEGGLDIARRRIGRAGETLAFELKGDVRRFQIGVRARSGGGRVAKIALADRT